MKIRFNIFIAVLSFVLLANTAIAGPFKADAKTRRIPAGTKFRLQLMDPINTYDAQEGYYFNAMLLEDEKNGTSVVLPAGSVIRGSVNKILPSRKLSRGAVLYLDFDHVVTPSGRQLPLNLSVCDREKITFDGGLYDSKGYGEAIQKNWVSTVNITKSAVNYGEDVSQNAFTGANYIAVPICAFAGALGGGAYFVGDSVIDLFRKGTDVTLNQGAVLDVMLIKPIDVPIN